MIIWCAVDARDTKIDMDNPPQTIYSGIEGMDELFLIIIILCWDRPIWGQKEKVTTVSTKQ